MGRNEKLVLLGRIMIDKHGENAAAIARRRAEECRADRDVADIWLAVAEIVDQMQAHVISGD